MARIDNEIKTTPSVLDRLLDFEPRNSSEPPKSRSKSLRELKQSIRRDLEWLLNTRRSVIEIADNLEETNNSMAVFGLKDLTGISVKSLEEQSRLIKEVERTLKTFEPRFLNLKVSLNPVENTDKNLQFRIEALLNIEPSPEPIAFDTILELGSGDFEVKEK